MTALIATGHSIDQKNDDVKGRFRPIADIEKPRQEGGASDHRDY